MFNNRLWQNTHKTEGIVMHAKKWLVLGLLFAFCSLGLAQKHLARSIKPKQPADAKLTAAQSIQRARSSAIGKDLRNAVLENTDLSGLNLIMAKMQNANLKRAVLSSAQMCRADLTGANLEDAILKEADLEGATLINAKLKGANLTKANLRGAFLMGSDLTKAVLFQADLTGANLFGANLTDSNQLANVVLSKTILPDGSKSD